MAHCPVEVLRLETADHYMEAMKGHADTIEYHGGRIALNPNLAPEFAPNGTAYTPEQREKIARDGTSKVGKTHVVLRYEKHEFF